MSSTPICPASCWDGDLPLFLSLQCLLELELHWLMESYSYICIIYDRCCSFTGSASICSLFAPATSTLSGQNSIAFIWVLASIYVCVWLGIICHFSNHCIITPFAIDWTFNFRAKWFLFFYDGGFKHETRVRAGFGHVFQLSNCLHGESLCQYLIGSRLRPVQMVPK